MAEGVDNNTSSSIEQNRRHYDKYKGLDPDKVGIVATRFKEIAESGKEGYEQLAIMYMILQQKLIEQTRRSAIFEKRYEIMKNENFTDDLTGLPNSKGYKDFVEGLKVLDIESSLTVVYIDVDNLKNINDDSEKGHECGNNAIKRVAKALNDTIRKDDFVFRDGGDEFCLILYDADEKVAQYVIDRATAHLDGINEIENVEPKYNMDIVFSYAIKGVEKDKDIDIAIDEAKGRADNKMQEKKKERRLMYEK